MSGRPRLRCPECGEPLLKPAVEGGVIVRNRFVRFTDNGDTVIGCPKCGHEVTAPIRPVLFFGGPG